MQHEVSSRSRTAINGKIIVIESKLVKVARLEAEWYEDAGEPSTFVDKLRDSPEKPDVFTFWQRLPNTEPKYTFHMEHEAIAALPISNYSAWWDKQISAKTRNMVRRAEKKGVVVKPADFDDEFVRGMVSIFNETPIRQGRHFWHYGKDFETVKRDFSRFLFREELFGAYVGCELVGFIMLAFADNYALLGQIISKIGHRDKAPTNALMARAVERCAEKSVPFLIYAKWEEGSLGDFKRHNGFKKVDMPRYFVPLTFIGKLWVWLKLYRGVRGILPTPVLRGLKGARRIANELGRNRECRATVF
jgi:hypothetical protein